MLGTKFLSKPFLAVHNKFEKLPVVSLIASLRMSKYRKPLFEFNGRKPFSVFSVFSSGKVKVFSVSHSVRIISMLRWSLYFSNVIKAWSSMLSIKGSLADYFEICKLYTLSEKNMWEEELRRTMYAVSSSVF